MTSYFINDFSCRCDRRSRMTASWLTVASGLFLLSLLFTDAFHFFYRYSPENQIGKPIKLHMTRSSVSDVCMVKSDRQKIMHSSVNQTRKSLPEKAAACKNAAVEKQKPARTNQKHLPGSYRQKYESNPVKYTENMEKISHELTDRKKIAETSAENSHIKSSETGPEHKPENISAPEFSASGLADALASMIDREKNYPLPAVRAGLEGIVTFLVKVDQNGIITDCKIIKNDAGRILVDAAEKTMEKIKNGKVPFELAGKTAEVEIPVVFRLD